MERSHWKKYLLALIAAWILAFASRAMATHPCADPAREITINPGAGGWLYGNDIDGDWVVYRRGETGIIAYNLRTGGETVVADGFVEGLVYRAGCFVKGGIVFWDERINDQYFVRARDIEHGGSTTTLLPRPGEPPITVATTIPGPQAVALPWLMLARGAGCAQDLFACRFDDTDPQNLSLSTECRMIFPGFTEGLGIVVSVVVGKNADGDIVLYYGRSPCLQEGEGKPVQWDIWEYNFTTEANRPFLADPDKHEASLGFDGRHLVFAQRYRPNSCCCTYAVLVTDVISGEPPVFLGEACTGAWVSNGRVVFVDLARPNEVTVFDARTGDRCYVPAPGASLPMISGPHLVWATGDHPNLTWHANLLLPVLSLPFRTALNCEVEVPVTLSSAVDLFGLSLAVEYDPSRGRLVAVRPGSVFSEVGTPYLFEARLDAPTCEPGVHGLTLAIIVSSDASRAIPPGDHEVARLVFRREATDRALRCGPAPLRLRDLCFGTPPVKLEVVTGDGEALAPTIEDGMLLPGESCFLRGDPNLDGDISIADPVRILFGLFAGRELPCQDAADVDDDGRVQLNDAILLLNYLFRGGPPPAAPFPASGADPSSNDTLTCQACP